MSPSDKHIVDKTPLVYEQNPTVEGRRMRTEVDAKITPDESISDRPVRKHFSAIVFICLAIMAFAVVLTIAFLHWKSTAAWPALHRTSSQPKSGTSVQ